VRRPRARTGLVVALLVALILAFAVRRPADPSLWPPPAGGEPITVYVVDNGYHSNIVLPRAALARTAGPSARALAEVGPGPWIAVGWGDRRFYTESGFNLRRALDGLRALFAPNNPAVTMFEPLRDRPDRLWRTGVLRIEVSPPSFAAMVARVDRSLRLKDGAPIAGPPGPDPKARFFASTEHFNLFKLCNHWTAAVLNAGGLPVRPVLDTLGSGLAFDLTTGALKAASDQRASVSRGRGLSQPRVHPR
jgi:hypothetical protein